MTDIIRYSFAEIENISQNFDGVLDPEIIKKLSVIKRISTFQEHTINIKYTLKSDSWRQNNGDEYVEELTQEVFESKIISNLNKLTGANYESIKNNILTAIDNIGTLEIDKNRIVDIIFDKATEEHIYSDIYAKLLGTLVENLDTVDGVMVHIFEKCKKFYDDNLNFNINELDQTTNYSEMCDVNKNKTLILGGIIFVSNLFNYKLVSYSWVNKYYNGLVNITKDIGNEKIGIYIDTLCAIMNTCGKNLKEYDPGSFNENFYDILVSFSQNKQLIKPKYRFKIKDTIEKF